MQEGYHISDIARLLINQDLSPQKEGIVKFISIDSRKIFDGLHTIFFALPGALNDGHQFIDVAIQKGVKNIVCRYIPSSVSDADVNFIVVDDVLKSLQVMVAWHRSKFNLEIVGITGSNGKTTVKEWLLNLCENHRVCANPKSYNSQVGVPLSIWQLDRSHTLGLFEAGISTVGEMSKLAKIIKPTIGLITSIGDAHDAGFKDKSEKISEKLNLLESCHSIIYCKDHIFIDESIQKRYGDKKLLSWGYNDQSSLFTIELVEAGSTFTRLNLKICGQTHKAKLPFTNAAAIENAMHCLATALTLGYEVTAVLENLQRLTNIPMRLEMKYGIGRCLIINDTYTADLSALKIGIDFLDQQAGDRSRWLMVSDFEHLGSNKSSFLKAFVEIISPYDISRIFTLGKTMADLKSFLPSHIKLDSYNSIEGMLSDIKQEELSNAAILVKGARRFRLDALVDKLAYRHHSTCLETDLQAVDHNLRFFSSLLKEQTKIIAVIKASAYGSGSEELARFLQYRKVAALAVAYADEGVYLRKCGVYLPIIILNPDNVVVDDLIKYKLQPEVYSHEQLSFLIQCLQSYSDETLHIHLKMDTGMHRLGFMKEDIDTLVDLLLQSKEIRVESIFSHLAGSEDDSLNDFTHGQAKLFMEAYDKISKALGYKPLRHLLNSSGILRFENYHFDRVRLGLGLYGIDSHGEYGNYLEKAHTLKAKIIQIKSLSKGDTVGYNRRGMLKEDSRIAIINIGYADGLKRMVGNGNWSASIRGKLYPTIGNVCMDLTMLNLGTDENIQVGDEVILFSKEKAIEDMAGSCKTIPYEILTSIGPRVKRIYTQG
jgi:alanine racemase